MNLVGAILKKVQSHDSVRYPSPPPEVDDLFKLYKRKKRVDKYAHVRSKVDTAPPRLDASRPLRALLTTAPRVAALQRDNLRLVMAIKRMHFSRGLVDCSWEQLPTISRQQRAARESFLKRVQRDNRKIYDLLKNTGPRVRLTAEQGRARAPPPPPPAPDPAFAPRPGFTRPRVSITLGFRGGTRLGQLPLELFTDACPRTCQLFSELLRGDGLGHCYVGTCFYSSELLIKVVSPEGVTFSAYFPEDTLVEEVKHRAIDYFYPSGESGASRYKIVRVADTRTLHDFLTLAQEQVVMQEELLLVERRVPEAGTLWDLGAVRAPHHATIAAATASLPPPQSTVRQPNLQSLLSTNELSYELRKILISLIEAGARLAAAGQNYEMTLAQLSAALEEPRRAQQAVIEVITPEDIAEKLNSPEELTPSEVLEISKPGEGTETYRRAEHLQRFLEKFRAWRAKLAEMPSPDALATLRDLGFTQEAADRALRCTGCNVPAAASWLIGERGSSVFELVNGLPDGLILQTLLKQPQIQRGLLNTRMLAAFIAMVGQTGGAGLWLNSPHGSPLLSQISRTYHAEKYCLAVNQFSEGEDAPSTSRKVPALFWSGGDVILDNGFGCYAPRGRRTPPPSENYHFPHCVPGLLTMHVTRDDEVCGTFSITFKALPHLDLRSVVFGRVVLPSRTFRSMQTLGSPISTQPVIEIVAAKFL